MDEREFMRAVMLMEGPPEELRAKMEWYWHHFARNKETGMTFKEWYRGSMVEAKVQAELTGEPFKHSKREEMKNFENLHTGETSDLTEEMTLSKNEFMAMYRMANEG